jgi:hypothetical protein
MVKSEKIIESTLKSIRTDRQVTEVVRHATNAMQEDVIKKPVETQKKTTKTGLESLCI